MKTNTASSCLEFVTTKMFPLVISLFSLLLSMFNFYFDLLRSPDMDIVVAPFISHVVDNNSLNEAFFIPLTAVNSGGRPGTILSLELVVTHVPSGRQANYVAQYFTKPEEQRVIGNFFTPITLQGTSTASQTLCFYPTGTRAGNFFKEAGEYEFQLKAISASARGGSQDGILQTFRVTLTDKMNVAIQNSPDGEYPFPIMIETVE